MPKGGRRGYRDDQLEAAFTCFPGTCFLPPKGGYVYDTNHHTPGGIKIAGSSNSTDRHTAPVSVDVSLAVAPVTLSELSGELS